MNWRGTVRWILKNTVVTNNSLTPQFRFHLITENCPLWMGTPDQCPLPDPYWAFYWPGGQAITKYIADRRSQFKNSVIIDLGCGNGSASIAGAEAGAKVIANDIDQSALLATKLNFRLNGISDKRVIYTDRNFLVAVNDEFLLQNTAESEKVYLILGDMFYDSDFALVIFQWLKRLSERINVTILAGSPDRHPLVDEQYMKRYSKLFTKKEIMEYALPGYVIREHYGFNVAKVYEITIN